MKIMDAIYKAEDLVTSTRDVASLALAVQEGIYHGMFATEHYEGAMNVLVEKAEAVQKQTDEAITALYKAMQDVEVRK